MAYLWLTLGWFFAALFALLTFSMLTLHNWAHALVMFVLTVLSLPPVSTFIYKKLDRRLPPLARGIAILGLLMVFFFLILNPVGSSIYKSPDIKAQFMAIYNAKMKDWPVPYEDAFVGTRYGKVHVIVSGIAGAPSLLLLHASGTSSWSWKYNVAGLSPHFRIYAIDLIGDVGKSEYTSLDHIMKTGKDQADVYAEITEKLGVTKARVVGASEGGFIATNYALYYPERVEKLVLLAPMGYTGTIVSSLRMMFTYLFPLKSIQENTFSWAFSDNSTLKADYKEWFPLLITGYNPAKVMPIPFTAEQRKSLRMPVMFVFGEHDNLVGDPELARALVQDIPNIRVAIVDAGHLMAGEQPAQINALILGFLQAE